MQEGQQRRIEEQEVNKKVLFLPVPRPRPARVGDARLYRTQQSITLRRGLT
jgi:hypothetical protein